MGEAPRSLFSRRNRRAVNAAPEEKLRVSTIQHKEHQQGLFFVERTTNSADRKREPSTKV